MLEQLIETIEKAMDRIKKSDDVDYLYFLKADVLAKLAEAVDALNDFALIADRLGLEIGRDEQGVSLGMIETHLESEWDALLRQHRRLQDRAANQPSYVSAWGGVRHTTQALNQLGHAIINVQQAQEVLNDSLNE